MPFTLSLYPPSHSFFECLTINAPFFAIFKVNWYLLSKYIAFIDWCPWKEAYDGTNCFCTITVRHGGALVLVGVYRIPEPYCKPAFSCSNWRRTQWLCPHYSNTALECHGSDLFVRRETFQWEIPRRRKLDGEDSFIV